MYISILLVASVGNRLLSCGGDDDGDGNGDSDGDDGGGHGDVVVAVVDDGGNGV
jgi:hypothetical protein